MSERKDGGPAFPVPEDSDGEWEDPESCRYWSAYTGMTLRDYFAAKAMQSLIATLTTSSTTTIVVEAYEFADAMLLQRGPDD